MGESQHGVATISVKGNAAILTLMGRCVFGNDGQAEPGLYVIGRTTVGPDRIIDGRTTMFLASENVIETAKQMAESRIG